jgi:hypothetical protein
MNWKLFAQPSRSHQRPKPWSQARFRPRLDLLEDRTLLSPVTFTIDPTVSSLVLSGMVGGQPIQEQGSGSLTTTYEGSTSADINLFQDKGGTIQFLGNAIGDEAIADISGIWQPLPDGSPGSAPANYGGAVQVFGSTAVVAVRGTAASAANAAPVDLAQTDAGSYAFPSTQTLCIDAGSAAYNHPLLQGAADLSGTCGQNAAAPGTLVNNGDGTFTIVVPVHLIINGTISGIPFTLMIDGVLDGQGPAAPTNTGSTGMYRENDAHLPISATTTFINPAWGAAAQAGRINTAEHELFHAIGFTASYTNFIAHVLPAEEGATNRRFTSDGTATGTLRARLTTVARPSHVDRAAGTVNGFDQTTALMQPNRVDASIRYTNRERDMLNDAFGWTGRNINIVVTFVGTFTADERAACNTAATDAQTLFGSNGTGHRFDWTVQIQAAAPGGGAPGIGTGHWFTWIVHALPEANRGVLSGTHSLAGTPLPSDSPTLGDLGSPWLHPITTDLAGTPAAPFQPPESGIGGLITPARQTRRFAPFDQSLALDAVVIDMIQPNGMTF